VKNLKKNLTLSGGSLFLALSFYAALIYPGGSQTDLKSVGFQWRTNYWCELMNPEAQNGQTNPGMPFAVAGMFCLGVAMSCFFNRLPELCPTTTAQARIVRGGSVAASIFAVLLFSDYHHLMLLGFSIFTFITILTALIILLENRRYYSFFSGLTVFLLIQLNNFIYYHGWQKVNLPWIQKLSILTVVFWVQILSLTLKDPTCSD
jgi:hypothetical protein